MRTKDVLVAVAVGFLLAKACSCRPKPLPPPAKPVCRCVYKRFYG